MYLHISVSVCPVHDLTFENFDLELGACVPAVPGTITALSGWQEHEQ